MLSLVSWGEWMILMVGLVAGVVYAVVAVALRGFKKK